MPTVDFLVVKLPPTVSEARARAPMSASGPCSGITLRGQRPELPVARPAAYGMFSVCRRGLPPFPDPPGRMCCCAGLTSAQPPSLPGEPGFPAKALSATLASLVATPSFLTGRADVARRLRCPQCRASSSRGQPLCLRAHPVGASWRGSLRPVFLADRDSLKGRHGAIISTCRMLRRSAESKVEPCISPRTNAIPCSPIPWPCRCCATANRPRLKAGLAFRTTSRPV